MTADLQTPIDPALMSDAQAAHKLERLLHLMERKRIIEMEMATLKEDLLPFADARIDSSPDNAIHLSTGLLKFTLNKPKLVYLGTPDPVPAAVRAEIAAKLDKDYRTTDLDLLGLMRSSSNPKVAKVLDKFGVSVVQEYRYDARPLPSERGAKV